jgi:peptidoglycan/LPS O-acetylase OafA/YrhL
MAADTRHERFEGIELLRFVLALGVVFFHYYFWAPREGLIHNTPGAGELVYLMLGVEAFFAVSGFVIILTAANRRPFEFLIARAARLGPTLLVASSLTLALYFLLGVQPRVASAAFEYIRSILFFPLARLGSGLDPSLWSLSFEIRFYLLIFVCMWLFDVRRHALAIAIGLLLYDFVRTALPAVTGHPFPARLDYFKDYTSFFVIGMLLYHRHVTGRSGPVWVASLVAVVLLTAVSTTRILSNMYDLTLHIGRIYLWQGAVVALVIPLVLAASMQSVRRPWLAVVFRTAGRASYPLYLVHQLCGYWILNFAVQHLHSHIDLRLPVVVGMVVLSIIYGNWFEPTLIRLYKGVLVDATGVVAGLLPRRFPVRGAVASELVEPAGYAGDLALVSTSAEPQNPWGMP